MDRENLPSDKTMYNALLNKDSSYEGIFIVGVKSTGIFCRPTCPARKPKLVNVEFFKDTKGALHSGYRPCRKCKPLEKKDETPEWISILLEEVNQKAELRWKDYELRKRELDPNRVRRWFKKNHGVTFHGYVRAIRLGLAIGNIKNGEKMAHAAYGHGFESLSGFREAITKFVGDAPSKSKDTAIIKIHRISTPLGQMIVGATDDGLCLLEFVDRKMLETQLKRLIKYFKGVLVPGTNTHIKQTAEEIDNYFNGKLYSFTVPLVVPGTEFQKRTWEKLKTIPYGETISYDELAKKTGNHNAVRAVANANGNNRIAIIIPCHRVIGKDRKLRGYGGGLWRKKRLIEHEGNMIYNTNNQ
jgi:AraC family transcriptional regulator of adaptative response/methylated-DNA-[protein]-cysteine methyltransferase